MKVMKNKYWADFIPLFASGCKPLSLLLSFFILVSVSSFLFLGCAARTHQGKVTPDVNKENPALADANSIDVNGLVISNQACSAIGNEVTFTVSMHNAPNPASALGFEIIYDESILEYKKFARGNLSQGFDMFDLSHTGANTLRVGGVIAQGEIAKGESGTLAELTFTIKQRKPASINLANLTDDLKGWPVHPGQLIVTEGTGSTGGSAGSGSESKERGKTLVPGAAEQQSEDTKTEKSHNQANLSSKAAIKNEGDSDSFIQGKRQDAASTIDSTAGAATRNEGSGDSSDSSTMDNSKMDNSKQGNTSTLVYSPKKLPLGASIDSKTGASSSTQASGQANKTNNTVTITNTNPGTDQPINIKNLTNQGTDQSASKPGENPNSPPSTQPVENPNLTPEKNLGPPPSPPQQNDSSEQTHGGSITIDSQSCSGAGEDVTFSISVSNVSNKVEALGFEVGYDESILEFKGFTRGDLVQGFSMFDVVPQPGTNSLRIGGVDVAASSIGQGAAGAMLRMTFKTRKCESSILSLRNLHDDLKGWSSKNGQLSAGGTAQQGAGLR